ncbi:hypothetical protein F4779DRAFT_552138 [Xylariaceae sp. FL0662B]|nr:hypothetical protein F4779DRAFT_552138 [Xylariaceae sp. FL0662B]
MKSTTLALGLLAGVASASYQHHPRHYHNPYWRRNETASVGPSTTLTVAVTSVQTITSCAPTVTNCPVGSGNSTGPAVVTQVVDLTTTVCPVTAAESVSSSLVNAHSSGLIAGTTRTADASSPATTSDASPEQTSNPGESVSQTLETTQATLTMTVGPESSKSILVTTIQSTRTAFVTVTAVPSGAQDASNGSGNGGSANGDESTTTTTLTSTGTRTVTVAAASSGVPIGSEKVGTDNGSGNNGCECAASTVTVTETAPASTVYITATGPAVAATNVKAATPTEAPSATSPAEEPASTDSGSENTDGGDVVATATQTVVPYPIGNGTVPAYPTGGFRR